LFIYLKLLIVPHHLSLSCEFIIFAVLVAFLAKIILDGDFIMDKFVEFKVYYFIFVKYFESYDYLKWKNY